MKTKCEFTKSNVSSQADHIVVIDTNLIEHKAPKDVDMAKYVDIIASAFSDNGVGAMLMWIILWGDMIENHKVFTEEVKRKQLKCIFKQRSELSSMLKNVSTANQTKSESLSKETRVLEIKLSRSLPLTFEDEFTAMWSKSNRNNVETESIPILIQAPDAQADPSIAKGIADGEASAVISGDTHFAMCIGCYKDEFDLMIKDVYINKKDLAIQSTKLVTGQKAVAFLAESALKTHMEGKLVFFKALKQRAKNNNLIVHHKLKK